MERNDFITMVQKASVKLAQHGNVFWKVPWKSEDLVTYREMQFVPVSYRLGFDNGRTTHTVELHSVKSNSAVIARLEDVKA